MRATIKAYTDRKRIVVAMSGGVDSSVAAYLLKERKRWSDEIIGLHMSNWDSADEGDEKSGSFCVQSEKDASDSQSVCDLLEMKMRRISFAGEYWTGVFEPFLEEIQGGKMMNPDVGCNSIVKFGAMREYAMKNLQADYISTGHYARLWYRDKHRIPYYSNMLSPPIDIQDLLADTPEEEWISSWGGGLGVKENGCLLKTPLLLAGADPSKDQSYFLSGVKGSAFHNTIFPLGDFVKKIAPADSIMKDTHLSNTRKGSSESVANIEVNNSFTNSVRDIALAAGLPTASKRESMGICFIGKRKFPHFIAEYLGNEASGNFVDVDTGEIVGKYDGSTYLTIGQGAKISGANHKWFIAKKDLGKGTVFVCSDTNHPALYSVEFYLNVTDFNWIAGEIPQPLKDGRNMRALCRTRHLHPLTPCRISWDSFRSTFIVNCDYPVRAITPGQTAALYVCDGLICLGGGPISFHGPSFYDLGLPVPCLLKNEDTATLQRGI